MPVHSKLNKTYWDINPSLWNKRSCPTKRKLNVEKKMSIPRYILQVAWKTIVDSNKIKKSPKKNEWPKKINKHIPIKFKSILKRAHMHKNVKVFFTRNLRKKGTSLIVMKWYATHHLAEGTFFFLGRRYADTGWFLFEKKTKRVKINKNNKTELFLRFFF